MKVRIIAPVQLPDGKSLSVGQAFVTTRPYGKKLVAEGKAAPILQGISGQAGTVLEPGLDVIFGEEE